MQRELSTFWKVGFDVQISVVPGRGRSRRANEKAAGLIVVELQEKRRVAPLGPLPPTAREFAKVIVRRQPPLSALSFPSVLLTAVDRRRRAAARLASARSTTSPNRRRAA